MTVSTQSLASRLHDVLDDSGSIIEQTLDRLTRRNGVHVRMMVEQIYDTNCLEDDRDDHAGCLRLHEAARWPVPQSFHDLDRV